MLSHIVSNELSISLVRLGTRWCLALPVATDGIGLGQHHSVTPVSQEVNQSGSGILQTNDAIMMVFAEFLAKLVDQVCQGAESVMIGVEPVSVKHITIFIGDAGIEEFV
jgi:hypothetical protein